jgi:hypothetical protein
MNAFAPIALLASTPLILFARSTMQANNLNELLLWLKANSNKRVYGIWRHWFLLAIRAFSKRNCNSPHPRTVSWGKSRDTGFGRWTD